jgi:hypothetical protein
MLEFEQGKPGVRELWRGGAERGVFTLNAPPQVRDGVIYGVGSESSALTAVSVQDGKQLWSTTVPSLAKLPPDASKRQSRHGTAFLVYHEANQQYWIFGEMGDLILAELSAEGYLELGRQHILEPTNGAWGRKVVWSQPAFANQSVFARNDRELIRVDLAD